MNIYITKENEEWLRTHKSMSGAINNLINIERGVSFNHTPSAKVPPKDAVFMTVDEHDRKALNKPKLAIVHGNTKGVLEKFKPCKHGTHPDTCKFSKPGKPCR